MKEHRRADTLWAGDEQDQLLEYNTRNPNLNLFLLPTGFSMIFRKLLDHTLASHSSFVAIAGMVKTIQCTS